MLDADCGFSGRIGQPPTKRKYALISKLSMENCISLIPELFYPFICFSSPIFSEVVNENQVVRG